MTTAQHKKRKEENIMPNVTGHTELVGLMAYPIRHTQSPTTHNLAYDKNGDDVIQLAFEVDNDSLKDAVQRSDSQYTGSISRTGGEKCR